MRPSWSSFSSVSRAISRRTPSKADSTTAFGRVVDDEVDAGEVLERADVAALAADDPALHVVGGQLDDRDRRLGGVARGEPLHRDREDDAHAALGVALGLLLDLAQDRARASWRASSSTSRSSACLACAGAHAGDALERARALVAQRLELGPLACELLARASTSSARAGPARPRRSQRSSSAVDALAGAPASARRRAARRGPPAPGRGRAGAGRHARPARRRAGAEQQGGGDEASRQHAAAITMPIVRVLSLARPRCPARAGSSCHRASGPVRGGGRRSSMVRRGPQVSRRCEGCGRRDAGAGAELPGGRVRIASDWSCRFGELRGLLRFRPLRGRRSLGVSRAARPARTRARPGRRARTSAARRSTLALERAHRLVGEVELVALAHEHPEGALALAVVVRRARGSGGAGPRRAASSSSPRPRSPSAASTSSSVDAEGRAGAARSGRRPSRPARGGPR